MREREGKREREGEKERGEWREEKGRIEGERDRKNMVEFTTLNSPRQPSICVGQ